LLIPHPCVRHSAPDSSTGEITQARVSISWPPGQRQNSPIELELHDRASLGSRP
jgi:hypothetical protein